MTYLTDQDRMMLGLSLSQWDFYLPEGYYITCIHPRAERIFRYLHHYQKISAFAFKAKYATDSILSELKVNLE